jgi:uncharacterized protein (TIGR02246 family)
MKQLLVITMIGIAIAAVTGGQTTNMHADDEIREGDERSIRTLMAEMDNAWNRGDAKAWSKPFAKDADFVNILGSVFEGRSAIERRHAEILATIFHGSRVTGEVRRVLFLKPDVAIVDVNIELVGYSRLPPGVQAREDSALRTRYKHIMSKGSGEWQIVASQNTDVKPLPK